MTCRALVPGRAGSLMWEGSRAEVCGSAMDVLSYHVVTSNGVSCCSLTARSRLNRQCQSHLDDLKRVLDCTIKATDMKTASVERGVVTKMYDELAKVIWSLFFSPDSEFLLTATFPVILDGGVNEPLWLVVLDLAESKPCLLRALIYLLSISMCLPVICRPSKSKLTDKMPSNCPC
ncbi:hypothetical protein B0T16DRAFT_387344 [Cercophora newfieldiana]|uniref:Uncharacterized protein n=1 Tax=Cercophora newfieldiana TaxID=92897 RepID=A0AA39YG40_9PEZI|nr:hypothetical protein B0T16DRAFT_387344 [Cercophora newfieldiana]